jgi:transposase InsO family protein
MARRAHLHLRAGPRRGHRPRCASVHAELADEGVQVGRKRVARLMRAANLQGVSRRQRPRTTQRQSATPPAPDLVQRDFSADGPNRLWAADITYVATWAGFLYLAVVVDAWSRRVVGWAMAGHLRTELVLQALEMALRQRRPVGVIHHSDQGGQYTALAFGQRCREAGVRPSMGSVGDCYDNALCESFSLVWNASCWTGKSSARATRRAGRCLNTSKVGTIRSGGIRPWATSRPCATNWPLPMPCDPKPSCLH